MQLHVAYNCPETLPRRRLEVIGTAGQAVATDTMGQTPGGTLEWIDAATGVAQKMPVPGADRSPFLNQVEAFAEAIIGDGCFPFTPEHDLEIMALILRRSVWLRRARASMPLRPYSCTNSATGSATSPCRRTARSARTCATICRRMGGSS